MQDSPILRAEHEEFEKRIEDEHKRINRRLEFLEKQAEQITNLAMSTKELAIAVKQMAEEQKKQGQKLEVLEGRDGEMWRKVIGYVVTAVAGILLGFVFRQIGM